MPPPASGLIARIVDLCRLRSGPQDLPHKPGLLFALLVASVTLDLLTASILGIGDNALARSLFSTTLLLALCWTALGIRELRNRYVQTLIALVACSMVFTLLILPIAASFDPAQSAGTALTPGHTLLAWLGLGVLVWKLAVDGHIVRQAIDAPYWLGLALAMAWTIADIALGRVLFGAAT